MKLWVNGEEREVPDGITVMDLLEVLGVAYREVGLAVSINEEVVPKGEYRNRVLQEGDRVEIIHLVGGG
ncbi:thiamine biosynthesis protein ThiS [Thermocrinis albus DSM 14484]|uniref:Thiamine biosynthesis protein ThiS n=1 Tax=Thermocrinis albus (strain DSM 14484 / JCM 11386 / HI 11/12) TaxID=638303 RepID=D3SMD4_THEAH|nr:sulfur carrier protein ThiS [Thermocrinis albus]ADC89914.1 thiamine biosynthesis protein ThiS [Thermocrinis albus DSM 14484]